MTHKQVDNMSLAELREEVRKCRKENMPPVSKMKKHHLATELAVVHRRKADEPKDEKQKVIGGHHVSHHIPLAKEEKHIGAKKESLAERELHEMIGPRKHKTAEMKAAVVQTESPAEMAAGTSQTRRVIKVAKSASAGYAPKDEVVRNIAPKNKSTQTPAKRVLSEEQKAKMAAGRKAAAERKKALKD